MKPLRATLLLAVTLAANLTAADTNDWRVTKPAGTRFAAVDIWLDSAAQPLAAYQLTFTARRGDVKIVGVEGGDHPAYQTPPYYDPNAMQHDRVILAAFNTATADKLPHGQSRVATIHLQVSGATAPVYAVKLQAAADAAGQPIAVTAQIKERSTP